MLGLVMWGEALYGSVIRKPLVVNGAWQQLTQQLTRVSYAKP